MSADRDFINQKYRLGLLVIYVFGLLVTSKIALNTWLPPTAEKGIWFYSALAALLLGNLLVTPYFTKPADAISYAVASFIALLAVNVWSSPALSGFDRFTWSFAVGYVIILLLVAVLAIVLKDSDHLIGQRFSRLFFELSDSMGRPRAVFSIVFIFALLTFHRYDPQEYLIIGMAWVIFVVFRPLESLVHFFKRNWVSWVIKERITRLGQIVGHESPNIVLVREDEGKQAGFGDVLLARSDFGQPGLALALDHVGFAEGRWLRATHFFNTKLESSTLSALDGFVFLIDPNTLEQEATNLVLKAKKQLIGLVASDTTVDRLNIEIVRSDLSLYLGSLVEVKIGDQMVLYQIIDGITREEIIQQKNTRGFVRAQAKKIGTWDAQNDCFNTVPWLPQPNESVFLVEQKEAHIDKNAIGHFPGTQYSVFVNLNTLVTHNSAILGILCFR